MGFFSKLFGDEEQQAEAPKPPPAPPRKEKDKDREAAAEPGAGAAESAKASAPAAEREAPRAPVLRSPPPPPPPPPLGTVAAVPPAAPAAAGAPPRPPPPAGLGKGDDASKSAPSPQAAARGGRSRAAKPAAPPPAAVKPAPAVKVGGAATVKRSSNATMRGMPAVAALPAAPLANERAFDPAAEAATIDDAAPALRGGASFDESAPSPLRRTEVSDDAVTLELAVSGLAPLARAVVDGTSLPQVSNDPAPSPSPSEAPGGAIEALDTAVDAAVDRLFDAQDSRQTMKDEVTLAAEREADQRAAAATFRELVAGGSAQLRELLFQLSVGRTPRHWTAACRPVIAPFLDGARQLELRELTTALADLDAALELAAGENGPYVSAQGCASIEEAYATLAAQLPEAFSVASDVNSRRLLLLESLLLQVPALYRRTLNKLYGAGLGSLEQLSGASPEEIAAVAGIDRSVAAAITDRVRRFEHERSRWNPAELRSQVHDQLRVALARLNQLQDQFERAEHDEAAERKRNARRARDIASHELDLLLSEIGELTLIEDLKRCAVHAKIRRLEGYLEQAQAAQ